MPSSPARRAAIEESTYYVRYSHRNDRSLATLRNPRAWESFFASAAIHQPIWTDTKFIFKLTPPYNAYYDAVIHSIDPRRDEIQLEEIMKAVGFSIEYKPYLDGHQKIFVLPKHLVGQPVPVNWDSVIDIAIPAIARRRVAERTRRRDREMHEVVRESIRDMFRRYGYPAGRVDD